MATGSKTNISRPKAKNRPQQGKGRGKSHSAIRKRLIRLFNFKPSDRRSPVLQKAEADMQSASIEKLLSECFRDSVFREDVLLIGENLRQTGKTLGKFNKQKWALFCKNLNDPEVRSELEKKESIPPPVPTVYTRARNPSIEETDTDLRSHSDTDTASENIDSTSKNKAILRAEKIFNEKTKQSIEGHKNRLLKHIEKFQEANGGLISVVHDCFSHLGTSNLNKKNAIKSLLAELYNENEIYKELIIEAGNSLIRNDLLTDLDEWNEWLAQLDTPNNNLDLSPAPFKTEEQQLTNEGLMDDKGKNVDELRLRFTSVSNLKEIATVFKQARKHSGLTQVQLAAKAGLSEKTIQRIENASGQSVPKIDTVFAIGKATGVIFEI